MEEGRPSGIIMYLGYYESEFDWSNNTEAEKVSNIFTTQKYIVLFGSQDYRSDECLKLANCRSDSNLDPSHIAIVLSLISRFQG